MIRRVLRLAVPLLLLASLLPWPAYAKSCPALAWFVHDAEAQETMKFRPVPPESVTRLERRRPRTIVTPAAPAPPVVETDEPIEPVEPDDPNPNPAGPGKVMRIGSDIHVEKGEVVDGDVITLGGDVRVDGHVRGNVASTGGDITLGPTARVDGDVMTLGGTLVEEPGAVVNGQRVTTGGGKISQTIKEKIRDRTEHTTSRVAAAIISTLIGLAAAWGVTKFAPRRTAVALDTLKREPGMCLVVGMIVILMLVPSLVAMALAVAILCITIIGIPIGIGVLFGYFVVLFVLCLWGSVVGVIPIGQNVGARTGAVMPSMTRAAVLGTLTLGGLRLSAALMHVVPVLGGLLTAMWVLVAVVVVVLGMGALVRSKIGQGPEGQWWPLVRRTPPVPAAPAPAAATWIPAPAPAAAPTVIETPQAPPPPPPPSPPSAFQPPPAAEPPSPIG